MMDETVYALGSDGDGHGVCHTVVIQDHEGEELELRHGYEVGA